MNVEKLRSKQSGTAVSPSMQEQSKMPSSVGRRELFEHKYLVRWCEEGSIRLDAEAEANNGDKAIDCHAASEPGCRVVCSASRSGT